MKPNIGALLAVLLLLAAPVFADQMADDLANFNAALDAKITISNDTLKASPQVILVKVAANNPYPTNMPIYVLRANTVSQMEQFLSDLFNLSEVAPPPSQMELVKNEAQAAIAAVLNGERWVDLPPGPSLVRRLEHEMARQAELISHSYGKEPRRHVRIFRE